MPELVQVCGMFPARISCMHDRYVPKRKEENMPYEKEDLDKQNKEVLKRNIKGSKEVIEERDERNLESEAPQPGLDDQSKPSVPENQPHKPKGGTTGDFQNPGGGSPPT